MGLATLNDHIVLPHLPDWSKPPTTTREWAAEVVTGADAGQDASSHRDSQFESLTWTVMPFDVEEAQLLEARIAAGIRNVQACAPKWGRGWKLAAASTDTLGERHFQLASDWPMPGVGDYVIFILPPWATSGGAPWEIRLIDSVDSPTEFTALNGGVNESSRTYPAGTFCWPLFFGRLAAGQQQQISGSLAAVELTLTAPAADLATLGQSTHGAPAPLR